LTKSILLEKLLKLIPWSAANWPSS